jgi:cation diffusion facilitator CzcD-associated flavoprotein CzcO
MAPAVPPVPIAATDVLVVGAGPAGLAAAGCLTRLGVRPEVIERARDVASSWRSHYERLHLHTVKEHSALPHMPFPSDCPKYVPRRQVVEYLASYAQQFGIAPRFGEEALEIRREDGRWQTRCRSGLRIRSRCVVLATGANHVPNLPDFPGRDQYRGTVTHSSAYRDATPFAGQRVLVIGMGNTGAEIALDLAEHGVAVALSVRSPVNLVYRDVLGRPTQLTSMALARLPTRVGDAIARLLRDLTVGDLRRWGIATPAESPLRQLREHGKTPVIDVGTLKRIKSGEILVFPGIERFTPGGVRFTDGREAPFDAVIFATGYRPALERLFPHTPPALDERGLPRQTRGVGPLRGVYFVGFDIRQPGGLLQTIAAQAIGVAESIARQVAPA